jgi:FkbM family methyltransferase
MKADEIISTLEPVYFSAQPDEADILDRLPVLLQGVHHFVDIGASLGPYTYRANGILDGALIESIEADPVRFAKLKENCSAWSAAGRNRIVANNYAIAARSEPVTFFTTQSNVSGGLFEHSLDHLSDQARARVDWSPITVPGKSLDDLYAATTPDFIKMDIEGAEWDALQSASKLLARRATRWLIELHDFGRKSPAAVVDLMRSHGYSRLKMSDRLVLFSPMPWHARLRTEARHWAGTIKRRIG